MLGAGISNHNAGPNTQGKKGVRTVGRDQVECSGANTLFRGYVGGKVDDEGMQRGCYLVELQEEREV